LNLRKFTFSYKQSTNKEALMAKNSKPVSNLISAVTLALSYVTHKRPHWDDIMAIWECDKWGEKKLPDFRNAPIIFWANGGETPDGRSPDEWKKKGYLLIGVGGSRFDGHGVLANNSDTERKDGECAASLMAKFLEIDQDPALVPILEFVTRNDLEGGTQPFDLVRALRAMYAQYPDDPQGVINWAMKTLNALYEEQHRFLTITAAEYKKKRTLESIPLCNGKRVNLVTIVSDDSQMSKFARSKLGDGAAVVIQWNSKGNCSITPAKRFRLDLSDVAAIIRVEQQLATHRKIVTSDFLALHSEGKIEGAQIWYYQKSGEMLLNGSLTATEVTPTDLKRDLVVRAVKLGLDRDRFDRDRHPQCRAGKCTSTEQDICPLFNFGLDRCQQVRSLEQSEQIETREKEEMATA
jgi:hypothetical protein